MRVAIFFDGKNFYSGWRAEAPETRIDLSALAAWLVEKVGGQTLWGAYYYTGVEDSAAADARYAEGNARLAGFLSALSYEPGFFVETFKRKVHTQTCSNCGHEIRYTLEKEVDTTMVADMLRLAAADAFDIMVLVSGDADFTPAADGVRGLGKKVFVATWGTGGLSNRLRESVFAAVDLRDFLPQSAVNRPSATADPEPNSDTAGQAPPEGAVGFVPQSGSRQDQEAFLLELRRAEAQFRGGYVGASFFLNRWRSDILDGDPYVRQRLLDELEQAGQLRVYDAPDGFKAIRLESPSDLEQVPDLNPS